MKENKLSDKKIINTLAKKRFIKICPICDECAERVIGLVSGQFSEVHCCLEQVEDCIYCLTINV